MEFKDFVAESLKQVVDGMETAQKYAQEKGARINPQGTEIAQADRVSLNYGYVKVEYSQLVSFDFAIPASEDKQAKGGAGIFIVPLTLGSQFQKDTANSNVSKIKFSAPLFLPNQVSNKSE